MEGHRSGVLLVLVVGVAAAVAKSTGGAAETNSVTEINLEASR